MMANVMCGGCGCYVGSEGHTCQGANRPLDAGDREGGAEGAFAKKALEPSAWESK
jgi:hypothetical protein